jgi:hypothetical protein
MTVQPTSPPIPVLAPLVGPGFARLDGPPGPDGPPIVSFPGIRDLFPLLQVPPTEEQLQQAAIDARQTGGVTGDIYITKTGDVYILEFAGQDPVLTLVANIAGEEGAKGADSQAPNHQLAAHLVTFPIEHVPGTYAELAAGPKFLSSQIHQYP